VSTKSVIDPSTEVREASERAMHAMFACLGIPRSYLDLACHNGYMVRAARMFGCKPSIGQTFDPDVKRDARLYARLIIGEIIGQFDLVTSIHSPLDAAPYVALEGHYVVARAFPFGKGELVCGKLRFDEDKTNDLQRSWTNVAGSLPGYVQVYVNG